MLWYETFSLMLWNYYNNSVSAALFSVHFQILLVYLTLWPLIMGKKNLIKSFQDKLWTYQRDTYIFRKCGGGQISQKSIATLFPYLCVSWDRWGVLSTGLLVLGDVYLKSSYRSCSSLKMISKYLWEIGSTFMGKISRNMPVYH